MHLSSKTHVIDNRWFLSPWTASVDLISKNTKRNRTKEMCRALWPRFHITGELAHGTEIIDLLTLYANLGSDACFHEPFVVSQTSRFVPRGKN